MQRFDILNSLFCAEWGGQASLIHVEHLRFTLSVSLCPFHSVRIQLTKNSQIIFTVEESIIPTVEQCPQLPAKIRKVNANDDTPLQTRSGKEESQRMM